MQPSLTRSFKLVLCAGVSLLAACSEGTGPNASGEVGLGFQLATSQSSASAPSAPGTATSAGVAQVSTTPAGLRITSGTDAIVITRAQVVVRDVKLKSAAATCLDDDDDDDKSSSSRSGMRSSDDDDDDDCPSIRVGPYLVNVPVSGADGGRVAVMVPEGTYSSVRLKVHKVSSSDSADLAFRQANPDFRNISIRLEGTYNTQPFTFVSDVNATLEVPLTAPVVIGKGGDNVTVTIDMKEWFTKPTGGLYSPGAANTSGFVQAKIQNNIRNTFRAFRDRNRDGKEDR
jgi:hypothetical protein